MDAEAGQDIGLNNAQKRPETFSKAERICSKRVVEKLFAGGNPSMTAFPLRVVFCLQPAPADAPDALPPACVLVSVAKKRLHHAVDRNRTKRQIREAYRHNKHLLTDALAHKGLHADIAFICLNQELCSSQKISSSMQRLLQRMAETLEQE